MEKNNNFCLTETLEKSVEASVSLREFSDATISDMLRKLGANIISQTASILTANEADLAKMSKSDPKYDRLKLTEDRVKGIVDDMLNVASLPSPLGKTISETERPNGLKIVKVSVPIGVIGVIYEARPNVTLDVFSLCIKAGNVTVLKGGSDADNSNRAIIKVINDTLAEFNIDQPVVTLLPPDREVTSELIKSVKYVDLIIPRGSQQLITFVRDNSKVPVIETGAGICHTYFHTKGDKVKAQAIVNNAKTRRVSVCNALDTLIVDRARLTELPFVCEKLKESNVTIYADELSYNALDGSYPEELLMHATDESFGIEYLDYKMSVKCVENIEEALNHIRRYSSKHSESIISEDLKAQSIFEKSVDAACVYSNVSTAFTDGAQFGLGAEIGISTQKLHARGPMALAELTSYKWLIKGDGQIRV